jgi:hypothetical protein
LFVGGHGDWNGAADGGTVRVTTLRTGEIQTDGGIAPGTPDLISGGVFVISGADVEKVRNDGPATTYGPNEMVQDNWGSVQSWVETAPVTSHGPSGIGFVNFGDLDRLQVRPRSPLTASGRAAAAGGPRRPDHLGRHRNQPRASRQVQLSAIALSIKPGGRIDQATIDGRIATVATIWSPSRSTDHSAASRSPPPASRSSTNQSIASRRANSPRPAAGHGAGSARPAVALSRRNSGLGDRVDAGDPGGQVVGKLVARPKYAGST